MTFQVFQDRYDPDKTQQHPQAVVGGSTGGESKQRKAKNGVDDKYHRMDGDAIRRARETGSRSGAMESHDSQPSQRRRHLMMMMMRSTWTNG